MQKGQILISRGSFALRWYERIADGTGTTKTVRRFKVIAPVLPEHKRSKNRIPREIQELAANMLEPLNNGTDVTALRTIGELVDKYLKVRQLKPSTQEAYTNLWKRYLKNRIAHRTVTDFRIVDAHTLFHQIHETNPKLSRQTMAHVKFFLLGVFRYAINNGFYYGINPASADLPEGLPGRKPTQAYTVDEINRLLSLLTSPLAQAIVALAFGSGMRKGELQGVRWEDYEPTDSGALIHVRRACWRGLIVTPKTESSADDVHIGPEVVGYLEAYRAFAGEVKEGFMFGYSHDKPINLDSFARWQLKPVMKKAGLVWKGWHGFRRGNATFLAKNLTGDGLKAAALVLRHSDESITQEHYVLNTKQERRAHQARKPLEIAEQRRVAAAALGAGIKQIAVN